MRLSLTPGPHPRDLALVLAVMTDIAAAMAPSLAGWDDTHRITDLLRDEVWVPGTAPRAASRRW